MTYLNSTAPNTQIAISDMSRSVEPTVILAPLLENAALETAIDTLTVSLAPFVPAELSNEPPKREVPLSFPAAQGITYTSRLRAMLPIFIAQLYAMFSVGRVQRGASSRIWDIRRALSALYKTEMENFNVWAVHALQANPLWQSQVREDLGGDAALARWEKRRERLALSPTQPEAPRLNPSPRRAASQAAARKKRTDSTGLFCLARLSRAGKPAHHVKGAGTYSFSQRPVALAFQNHRAIPLTPDQLRVQSEDSQAAKGVTYKHLTKIWTKMHSEHLEWDYQLVIADLMLSSPELREELVPP